MYKSFSRLILAAILSTACASTQQPGSVPSNEPQTPSRASPSPTVELSTHGWQFKFMDEAHSYTSVTRTTIESLNTPVSSADTFTTQSHFSITVNHQQVPSVIFGELNPVKVTVSQRAHNQALAISAIAFAGSINSGQVLLHLIPIPADSDFCNNPATSYLSELHAGILAIPAQVQTGSSWTDTLSTTACSGDHLPLILQIIRLYQVQGIAQEANLNLLFIKRAEQIQLFGNGSQGQHQMQIKGEGSGSADLFLNPETGNLQSTRETQRLTLTLLTSGKSYQFKQQTSQRIDLIR